MMLKCCACHTENRWTGLCNNVEMLRSATLATRNHAMQPLKPPKVATFVELARGTAMLPPLLTLATVANGCERLWTVADVCEHKRNVEQTHLNPQAPKRKREPLAMHSGKNPAHTHNNCTIDATIVGIHLNSQLNSLNQ